MASRFPQSRVVVVEPRAMVERAPARLGPGPRDVAVVVEVPPVTRFDGGRHRGEPGVAQQRVHGRMRVRVQRRGVGEVIGVFGAVGRVQIDDHMRGRSPGRRARGRALRVIRVWCGRGSGRGPVSWSVLPPPRRDRTGGPGCQARSVRCRRRCRSARRAGPGTSSTQDAGRRRGPAPASAAPPCRRPRRHGCCPAARLWSCPAP